MGTQSRRRLWAVVAGVSFAVGCGGWEPPQPQNRVETFPVTGQVHVDGNPVAQIAVRLHPVGSEKNSLPTASGFTDEEGRFSIGTYESGGGAPAGTYVITFQWGQVNLLTGRYEGDKFRGRYADPEKSTFRVVVEKGKPADVGLIELVTK